MTDEPESEEVLGAGMAVLYNSKGITAFVFLDEDDRPIRIDTADLDLGWKEKLISVMSSGPGE